MRNERAIYQMLSGALILAGGIMTQGCAGRHSVVAVTGTVIGVEIAQNPQTQMYQAKLGYNRGEFALVPTNRSANEEPGNQGGGAKDSTDVLMELRYGGIFSKDAGIYQRLAVGKTAVSQPGAAFMFAKGNDGELGAEQAEAISQAMKTVPEVSEEIEKLKYPLGKAYTKFQATHKDTFDKAAGKADFKDFRSFLLNKPAVPTADQIGNVRKEVESVPEIKTYLDGAKAATE